MSGWGAVAAAAATAGGFGLGAYLRWRRLQELKAILLGNADPSLLAATVAPAAGLASAVVAGRIRGQLDAMTKGSSFAGSVAAEADAAGGNQLEWLRWRTITTLGVRIDTPPGPPERRMAYLYAIAVEAAAWATAQRDAGVIDALGAVVDKGQPRDTAAKAIHAARHWGQTISGGPAGFGALFVTPSAPVDRGALGLALGAIDRWFANASKSHPGYFGGTSPPLASLAGAARQAVGVAAGGELRDGAVYWPDGYWWKDSSAAGLELAAALLNTWRPFPWEGPIG